MKKAYLAGLFLMSLSLIAEAGTLLRWPLEYYAGYSRHYDHDHNDLVVPKDGSPSYCSGGGSKPCPTRIYTGASQSGADGHHGTDILGNGATTYVHIGASGTLYYAVVDCPNPGYYGSPCGNSFGNHVRIQHSDGKVSVYAHMLPWWPGSSGWKPCGQVVGIMGSSGSSTGTHLHLGLWSDSSGSIRPDVFGGPGNYVNASYWVNQDGSGTAKPSMNCQ